MATESDDADHDSIDDVLRRVAVAPSLAPPAPPARADVPRRHRARPAFVALVVFATVLVIFAVLARSDDPASLPAPAALIDASTRYVSLAPYLDILDDRSAVLTIDDVRSPENAARFARSTNRFGVNNGLTTSAIWVRLAIENRSAATLERWLVLDTTTIETIHVFRDGEPPAIQGVLHPRNERELPRRSYSFRIALALEAILFAVALADAARTRNAELIFTNKELQRQIADRAGQLAAALARLASAPSRALAPGDVVDERYRLIRSIGQGGMGAVYEAERLDDRRRLALKTLAHVANPRALARFAREAQVAAALDHPNIVAVLDVDVSKSGMLFLVMPLVAGSSLDRARDRYGDLAWARPIIAQIADALVAMHDHGIVHRDLKPSNVLLDGDRVKVIDFGIANVLAIESGEAIADGDTALAPAGPLTHTGHFIGTPLYMAPELADGVRTAGPAADMFSLAPSLPPGLAAVVDRCLAHMPGDRPSAGELAEAFHREGT